MSSFDDAAANVGEGSGSNYTVVYPEQIKLKPEVPNIIRLVDINQPKGMARIREAWCICDDNEKRSFIIDNEFEGPSLLFKMLGDLNDYGRGGYLETQKVTDAQGKNKAAPLYEHLDPELYLRIAKNGDSTGKEGSWRGREIHVCNAIQRWADVKDGQQFFWCKENKHTKLLYLIQQSMQSLTAVKANDGDPCMYDIAYMKTGSGKDTKHNILKAGAMVPGVVIGDLSPEEKSYEIYKLDETIKNSPSLYVLKFLRNTLERVDNVMGTNWVAQHEAKAEQEKAAFAEARGEQATPATQPAPNTNRAASVPPQQPTPQPAPVQSAPQPTPQATQVRGATPQVRGAAPEKVMFLCQHCNTMISDTETICTNCGKQVKAPCTKCGFVFSVFENTCPSCKFEYSMGTTE